MEQMNDGDAVSGEQNSGGIFMGGYADVGVSSMMALMTHQQQQQQQQQEEHSHGNDGSSIISSVGLSSFPAFQTPPECLLSAAMINNQKFKHLMMPSVKSEPSANQFSVGKQQGEAENSSALQWIMLPMDSEDVIKSKIMAHPQYPALLAAYIDCHKVGAPAEIARRLDAIGEENRSRQRRATSSIGMDPELDQFMEAYCEMLTKYQQELTKPFNEAMSFFSKIEGQLSAITKGAVRISRTEMDENSEGGSSEEDGSCCETEQQEVLDHHVEERDLKDHLLRKFGGRLGPLKQEFMKKKKKGKLPKDARQKLLDWWNHHYKWPYPSENEKIALAESTGLDQKQINNWFINQRKRHWKPSEDMQFVVVDGHVPHAGALYVEAPAFHLDC